MVTLKNGKVIAARYGDQSFTSSAPAPEQIFLEEEWLLNEENGLDRPKEQSAGVIVTSTELEIITLFHYSQESADEQGQNSD